VVGDFEGLVAVLDPDVVLRSDYMPGGLKELRGARVIAQQAMMFSKLAASVQPVLVNGAAGIVSWRPGGQPFSVMGFTVGKDGLSKSTCFVIPLVSADST